MDNPRTVFLSIAAQADNLGDIAIRQVCVNMVARSGASQVIFVGNMPRTYLEAFDLPGNVRLERSARRYSLRLVTAVLRGKAHIVFAPGPFGANGLARTVKSLGLLGLITMIRGRGGQVVAVGRAIRGNGKIALSVQRATIGAASIFTTRDDVTASIVRRPVVLRPDLALYQEKSPPANGGDRLAISLRSDKPVSREALQLLVSEAEAMGLRAMFVTQVKRDDERHRVLAEELGAEHVAWDTESHVEQFSRVQAAYRRSRFVVTDRLHAAIFGIRGGAIPIIVQRGEPDKLVSTLGPYLTVPRMGLDAISQKLELTALDTDVLHESLTKGTATAFDELEDLSTQIAMLLRPKDR